MGERMYAIHLRKIVLFCCVLFLMPKTIPKFRELEKFSLRNFHQMMFRIKLLFVHLMFSTASFAIKADNIIRHKTS